MRIFEWLRNHGERRGGPRIRPCDLVAYYWTGAAPEPRLVRDIGISGAFVEGPEAFYPGTLIQMALVDQSDSAPGPEGRFFVCAKALAPRTDGFGVCFPFLAGKERRAMQTFIERLKEHAAARLARFDSDQAGEQAPAVADVPSWDAPKDPVTEEEKSAVTFHSREAVSGSTQDTEEPEEDFEHKASNGDSARGQALIEFALILPLLFLLIVNVINFGMFIFAWISVSGTARTGAQYLAQGGAMVGGLAAPSLSQVQTLVSNDLQGLPNGATATVKVCRVGDGCIPSGTPTTETGEPGPGGTTVTYAMGTVDVTYTYTPIIRLWSFPGLGISATLPPTSIHRRASMRALQ